MLKRKGIWNAIYNQINYLSNKENNSGVVFLLKICRNEKKI